MLLLVTGVVLVCRPPFLFHSDLYKALEVKFISLLCGTMYVIYFFKEEEYKHYNIGLILTLVATACGAVMNVVISE